ncbi:MAG: Fic family protein [Gemmatimonadaceae bacterium]|nr:Fic family protein [Gemmatimonadaceae bacterium]
MPGSWRKQTWQYNPVIDAPAKYRRACHYDAFIPARLSELELRLPADVAGLVSDAETAVHRLNATGGVALAPLARLLLRTESIASSKVEGMQVGVREMARAEAQAETGGAPSRTALELIDNINAMELAVGQAADAERFGPDEIVAIHTRLMQHAPNRHLAGRIRTQQNWIGGNDYNPCGADFVPPPPDELDALMHDLCDAINSELLPPVIQAALVHAQFETIHPFEDGNGRTGRALVHVVLRRRGLAPRFLPPISVVLAGARIRYINGLTGFRSDQVTEWIDHFADATARAARLANGYVHAVDDLRQRWRAQLANSAHAPRAGAAAWALIDVLPAHPIVTAPVATTATGRVKTAIYTAIEQLVTANVLTPLSASKRNRAWEADGLLALIERLEAGQLPE